MNGLTHLDAAGAARMVDVTAKDDTDRIAVARGTIYMNDVAFAAVRDGTSAKGDVVAVARVAGIMAAKRTSELIPLCHPLALSAVALDFEFKPNMITVSATVRTSGPTGVEMEALTAVSVAMLTLYDMAKALDKGMILNDIGLVSKSGGKSGTWQRSP